MNSILLHFTHLLRHEREVEGKRAVPKADYALKVLVQPRL